MKSNLLQMGPVKTTAENFRCTVGTVEANLNLKIRSIANEDCSGPMFEIDLANQEGNKVRLCKALLLPEHVEALIGALNVWKGLQ